MSSFVLRPLLPFALAAVLSGSATAQTIDNLSNWNGATGLGFFGTGGGNASADTYGQTFVAPAQSFLTSWETAFNSQGSFTYRFYVAPWDAANVRLAGAPVFASGDLTAAAAGGYVPVSIATNVLLTPGVTYMAFASTSELPGQPSVAAAQAGYYDSDTYIGGGFYKNDASSFANLGVDSWDGRFAGTWDTAFRANFQAVPEPASLAALGLGAAAFMRRRRLNARQGWSHARGRDYGLGSWKE